MRRPRATRVRSHQTANVSLFPFLAVLICTMGALILLLVILAHQARLQAVQAAQAADLRPEDSSEQPSPLDPQREKKLIERREDAQWRAEQIRVARQETEKDLADARLELGHIEEHIRDLLEEFDTLRAAAAELERLPSADESRHEQVAEELRDLKAQLAEAQGRLAEARKAAGEQPPSYAVVPYEGPLGTRRRPIYIECREDRIILQPEGVTFSEADFEGSLGPGNPLDASLRAVREYLLRQKQFDRSVGEPYPLLLVRPEGIAAYYAARTAVESWGSEFGYELVDEGWQLSFPPPDPALAKEVELAVYEARVRQKLLARQWGGGRGGSGTGGGAVLRLAPGGNYLVPKEDVVLSPRPKPRRQSPAGPYAGRAERPGEGRMPTVRRPQGYVAGRAPVEQAPQGGSVQAARPGEWQPPAPRDTQDAEGGGPSQLDGRSLAKRRGRGWALPKVARDAMAAVKPIRIDCYPDRLVIAPHNGPRQSKTIPFSGPTEAAVDPFISAVWEQIDSWGLAGLNTYWRPVLTFYLAPGAEARYEELEALLDGSGLEVKRGGQ